MQRAQRRAEQTATSCQSASPVQSLQVGHTTASCAEPLTANQVSGLAESAGYWHGDMSRADFITGIRYAEAAHDLLYTAQRTTGVQARAIAEARIALSDLMTAPEPVLATRAWPKVSGVSRDEGHPRALLVFFSAEPTDDEMRAVHGTLAAAPTTQPVPQREPTRLKPVKKFGLG